MASSHIIDPDGDVDLVLRQESELRMDWGFVTTPSPSSLGYRRDVAPDAKESKKKKKGRRSAFAWDLEPEPAPEPEPELEAEPEQGQLAETPLPPDTDDMLVRIRVSSRHLMLASSYFKRSLGGELAEGHTLRSERHVEVDMKGQDPDTMLLVMNVIHGRFRRLPLSVDLNALTRVAALVDYLECHEVVEPFVDKWIEQLKGDITEDYSKELIQWLCISQVFNKETLFEAVTRIAICRARDLIDKADLPIRDRIEDELNRQRSATIENLLSGLENLLQDLLHDRNQCDYECNALRYGTLTKELASRGLHSPGPQAPYLGYSFENIVSSVVHIQDSPCRSLHSRSMFGSPCASNPQINTLVQQIEQSLKGLSLDKF
ncbi:hypothetical protein BDV96DRAFT_652565 [Lophiotrema nucula]|uniref:BTB domain-containing protein n=1 Tax=Lophiotrema nucula TaxID=690887 RepID=A0A6A5YND1_9PLEO|nr:hypothetical protein BDV96DRAFT_652565 [Lophiotrema nucula]